MLRERKNTDRDDSGYCMKLEEASYNQVELKWGSYINPVEKTLCFYPDKNAIVSHFQLVDPAVGAREPGIRKEGLKEKEFVVYRQSTDAYELYAAPTREQPRRFFELVLSDSFFDMMITEESAFLSSLYQYSSNRLPASGFTASMLPGMFTLINDMYHAPYSGSLKGLYLEAKAIELFLMQINQLGTQKTGPGKLKGGDIAALYWLREYIDSHYLLPCTITGLARKAGINQTKLKTGFKELFNTTIFGYISDLRMQEARRLLLDEKMYVGEVADRIGYQHPHHFTVAFKKRFGVLPKDLKK